MYSLTLERNYLPLILIQDIMLVSDIKSLNGLLKRFCLFIISKDHLSTDG